MGDEKKLWDNVLNQIELGVSKANFTTWFKNTEIVKQEEGIVFLGVPNAFVKEWLTNKFHKTILKHLREFGENVRSLEYIVTKDGKRSETTVHRAENPTRELPLQEHYINKEDNLNPRYTFESFVIGPFNELAFAASQAVIKKPGENYNPLFIYGDTGHGKTHLIQSIGNHIKAAHPGKKIFYVTSEKFVMDYVSSMQANRINKFKEQYRKYDVLIMDDIQFLSNKEKSQEELFHLFNIMHEGGKQIVFSSDKHPNFIPNLEDRLKSRFSQGMIVDIPKPDQESRAAILKSKLRNSSVNLSDEVVYYLAGAIEGNIRELEGVLNTLICQAELKGKELSLLEVKNLIKGNIKPKKILAPKDIVKVVANYYNIDENAIYDKTRRKEVVMPRQLVMYILREDCNYSYPSIGDKLGGRDHTTVIHSCEKIKHDLKTNSALVEDLNQVRAML